MKYLISPFLLIMFSLGCEAQPKAYNSYFDQIIRIEEFTANEEFERSVLLYKELFGNYDRVFARDAYNACQLAALTHSNTFACFLDLCAKSGVGKSLLTSCHCIADQYRKDTVRYDSIFNQGRQVYFSRIDIRLRNEFMERFREEQEHKGKADYKSVCYDNFERILQLSKQGKFPGEDVIGVDENLENSYVFATLKHYPYSYVILADYLWASVQSGGTQPLAVLYVYGFNQSREGRLYGKIGSADTVRFRQCYNLPFGKYSGDLAEVDKARREKQVFTTLIQQKLGMVSRKYDLDYKFGY